MQVRGRTAESFERTTRELNAERAAALRSIGGKLESLIEKLHASRIRLASLADDARGDELHAYREWHRQARQYRWYLEVQRESLGLRQHHHLDEFYPIPDDIG